jgi:hypothetical protein
MTRLGASTVRSESCARPPASASSALLLEREAAGLGEVGHQALQRLARERTIRIHTAAPGEGAERVPSPRQRAVSTGERRLAIRSDSETRRTPPALMLELLEAVE